jgi:MFS family permease
MSLLKLPHFRLDHRTDNSGSGGGVATSAEASPSARPQALAENTNESVSQTRAPAPHASPARRPSVLRHRHFRNVWLAALGSNIGTWIEVVAIQWTMAQLALSPDWQAAHLPNAPVMMGWLASAQFLPTLILGLYGGLIADRVNRRTLLITTQLLLALVAAMLAIIAGLGLLQGPRGAVLLMICGAINGTIMAFNIPAWQVLTPRLVPRNELTAAITLNGVQFNLSRVVGPAIGGLMLGLWSPTALFLINAVSFLGVVAVISTTPDAPAPPRDASIRERPWAPIWAALRYAFTTKGPAQLILATAIFSMLGTPLLRMMPILVTQVYEREEATYGSLLSVMGMGAVLGGLALRFVPAWYPKHHFVPMSVMLGGVSIVAFAAADTLPLAAVSIFIVGVFWMWAFNPAFAALQMLVPDEMRGRVLAIASTLSFGTMPLGALAAGGIAWAVAGKSDDGFGVQVGVGVLALILAISGLFMLIWRTPEVDGLQPGDLGYDRRPGLWRGITASGHKPRS